MKTALPASLGVQFAAFCGVGALATAVHYTLLVALVELAGVGAVAASSAGAALGALVGYALNRRYTFRSGRRHGEALPRFAATAAAGWLLNAAVMYVATQVLGLHYLAAQVLATGIVLAWNFGMNRAWTFAESRS